MIWAGPGAEGLVCRAVRARATISRSSSVMIRMRSAASKVQIKNVPDHQLSDSPTTAVIAGSIAWLAVGTMAPANSRGFETANFLPYRLFQQLTQSSGSTLYAALGIPAEWHISPGVGHGIDQEGLRQGGEFLARLLKR